MRGDPLARLPARGELSVWTVWRIVVVPGAFNGWVGLSPVDGQHLSHGGGPARCAEHDQVDGGGRRGVSRDESRPAGAGVAVVHQGCCQPGHEVTVLMFAIDH